MVAGSARTVRTSAQNTRLCLGNTSFPSPRDAAPRARNLLPSRGMCATRRGSADSARRTAQPSFAPATARQPAFSCFRPTAPERLSAPVVPGFPLSPRDAVPETRRKLPLARKEWNPARVGGQRSPEGAAAFRSPRPTSPLLPRQPVLPRPALKFLRGRELFRKSSRAFPPEVFWKARKLFFEKKFSHRPPKFLRVRERFQKKFPPSPSEKEFL